MREVQILNWCDIHWQGEDRVEAVKTVRLDDHELEVCAEHYEQVDALMSELASLFALGTKVEKVKRKASRPVAERGAGLSTTCPYCGYAPPTRSALGQHLRSHHDSNFTKAREEGHDI